MQDYKIMAVGAVALALIGVGALVVNQSFNRVAKTPPKPVVATAAQAGAYAMKQGVPLQDVLNTCLSEAAAIRSNVLAHYQGQVAPASVEQQYDAQKAACYRKYSPAS